MTKSTRSSKIYSRFALGWPWLVEMQCIYSPIFKSEVKGGAYSVTLHLYRRAVAGEIARGLSLHKRSGLHFVRGSKEEAARVAEEAKNRFESGRQTDGNGFSAACSAFEKGIRVLRAVPRIQERTRTPLRVYVIEFECVWLFQISPFDLSGVKIDNTFT
jgi:hypothetical protein